MGYKVDNCDLCKCKVDKKTIHIKKFRITRKNSSSLVNKFTLGLCESCNTKISNMRTYELKKFFDIKGSDELDFFIENC